MQEAEISEDVSAFVFFCVLHINADLAKINADFVTN